MLNFNIDFEDFDYKKLISWERLLNDTPRFPILCIADCILCCYLIRSQLKIRRPLVSFVFALALCTMADNAEAFLNRRKLAIFTNPYFIPFITVVWILYNYTPFDLLYKITRLLSPFIAIIAGFIAGRDITHGIDLAVNIFPKDLLSTLATGILFAAAKYLAISVFGRLTKQNSYRSAGPILFGILIGANAYYWFTDLGHFSNTYWYDKEQMKLFVSGLLSLFGLLHFLIPDRFFSSIWDGIEYVFGLFVPYYGKTWNIPKTRRIIVKSAAA